METLTQIATRDNAARKRAGDYERSLARRNKLTARVPAIEAKIDTLKEQLAIIRKMDALAGKLNEDIVIISVPLVCAGGALARIFYGATLHKLADFHQVRLEEMEGELKTVRADLQLVEGQVAEFEAIDSNPAVNA